MDNQEAATYLAAFIDGEGHIGLHTMGSGGLHRTVSFSNTDKQLFDRAVELASQIGLHFRIYHRRSQKAGWSEQWVAYLRRSKESFVAFRSIVPLQCDRKSRALTSIIDSYKSAEQINEGYISRRTRVNIECKTCGTGFDAWPAYINRGQGRFCSVKCRAVGRQKPKADLVCEMCGSSYAVSQARKDKSRFCSRRCTGLAGAERVAKMAFAASQARWKPKADG